MRLLIAGAIAAAAAMALLASGGVAVAAQPFAFVAIGDMPYRLPDDYARFERLIAEINRVAPAFTVHVGDIKGGSTPCTDESFQKNKDYFGTFEQPLVYTPGDNEWTDCHRERAGRFDPLERLAKIRSMFFERPESFGRRKVPLERQAEAMPAFKTFVENQRWSHEGWCSPRSTWSARTTASSGRRPRPGSTSPGTPPTSPGSRTLSRRRRRRARPRR